MKISSSITDYSRALSNREVLNSQCRGQVHPKSPACHLVKPEKINDKQQLESKRM